MKGYTINTGQELWDVLDELVSEPDKPVLVELVIPKHNLAPAMAGPVESITGNTVAKCNTK